MRQDKTHFSKVFDQTFFKKFAGFGAAPQGLQSDAPSKNTDARGMTFQWNGWA
jgi:hypothetical protein